MKYNNKTVDETGVPESEEFCYLTTKGRKTGQAHTIEIWYAMEAGSRTLYMLSGGRDRSDWVKNIAAEPEVQMRITNREFRGSGRVVTEPGEEMLARRLVVKKYYGRDSVRSSGWEAESLPMAIDVSL